MQSARWCLALLVTLVSGCRLNLKEFHEIKIATNLNPSALQKLCGQSVSGACALIGAPSAAHHSLPILQGVTSEEQSRFVVLAPKSETLDYYVRRPGHLEHLSPQRVERDFSDQAIDQFTIVGLNINESYELIVLGSGGELWDRRTFHSLNLRQARAKILLISCLDDSLIEVANKIWPEALAQKPEAILMIGDNVYADKKNGIPNPADPQQIWQRYVDTRLTLPVFRASELVPVFATWDDHDFGRNDSDRTFPYKEAAKDTFFAFFPQRESADGFERGLGVASYLTAFGVHFALLDDRSFRTPNQMDIPDQSHFGQDQEVWLQQKLQQANSPVFLVSGDQFFGGYHERESFEGSHPRSFKASLQKWRHTEAPLVFLSGDRHLTEIIDVPEEFLGYSTFEITSSPMHARVFPGELLRKPNPRQIVGRDGTYNYSIIEIMNVDHKHLQFAVSTFTLDQQLIFQKTLTVSKP